MRIGNEPQRLLSALTTHAPNTGGVGGAREQMLPDGAEIARMRAQPEGARPTFAQIGERYGVSRQAVHKAYNRWLRDQRTNAEL